MTYKDKENILKYIFKNYPLIKDFYLKEMVIDYGTRPDLNTLINRSLRRISKESRRIITKEYVEGADEDWWYEYYSRSSYYRLKNKALDEFINQLNG